MEFNEGPGGIGGGGYLHVEKMNVNKLIMCPVNHRDVFVTQNPMEVFKNGDQPFSPLKQSATVAAGDKGST